MRFTGLLREDGAETAQPFDEVWNLKKPVPATPAGCWPVSSNSSNRTAEHRRPVPFAEPGGASHTPFAHVGNPSRPFRAPRRQRRVARDVDWARTRLAPHAGKSLRVEVWPLAFAISAAVAGPIGDWDDAAGVDEADATLRLTPAIIPLGRRTGQVGHGARS